MHERRNENRTRTLRSGKIIFNDRRSVIDCVVRNLSESGACLQVNATVGIPQTFELLIDGVDSTSRLSRVTWMSETRTGIEFCASSQRHSAPLTNATEGSVQSERDSGKEIMRRELLMVRAALDEVPVGIVLLDENTRAQFINRAFRQMWRLPDDKADCEPPFVALMYHGRDTHAYATAPDRLDAYVAERVAHVNSGDPRPLDLRLASGEIIRLQCSVLPSGGRMLCYTYVTDIVQNSDKLEMLRSALDQMQPGVILLDEFLNAQFMNRAVRNLWGVTDEQADRTPAYIELVGDSRTTGAYGVPADALGKYIANRVAVVRAGDPTPMDIPHSDGRMIRSQCAILPGGGRMLTYTDITDLVRRANQFEQLATLDGMTGLYNRRHFEVLAEAEWSRFQRYHRPLSVILIDIDRFKQINDRRGHEAGDLAIARMAALCNAGKRTTDVAGRIGGDEFAILLPETNIEQARVVAERLRESVVNETGSDESADHVSLTVSIGVAAATLSMSGVGALLRLADKALYDAKAAGRNCTRCAEDCFTSDLQTAAE